MEVRVTVYGEKLATATAAQEILTGMPAVSLKNLIETIGRRHPEVEPILKELKTEHELRVFVNNSEIPESLLPQYYLRDGDTVSLFASNP